MGKTERSPYAKKTHLGHSPFRTAGGGDAGGRYRTGFRRLFRCGRCRWVPHLGGAGRGPTGLFGRVHAIGHDRPHPVHPRRVDSNGDGDDQRIECFTVDAGATGNGHAERRSPRGQRPVVDGAASRFCRHSVSCVDSGHAGLRGLLHERWRSQPESSQAGLSKYGAALCRADGRCWR